MTDLQSDLRFVIGRYGIAAVHQALLGEMRDTYEYLRQIFEPPKNNLVIPVGEVIPDRIATPHHKPLSGAVAELEPPSLELNDGGEASLTETVQETQVSEKDQSLKEVVIQAKKEMIEGPLDKFSKAKHREEVAKKYKELQEKGIRPEDLLTKENLSLWLGQGLSYMRIAREHTGVPDTQIAAIAKNFGLQSDIKKYIVMKKGGK